MTDEHPLRVPFLSRRNTARSLMAEAVMNQTRRRALHTTSTR